MPLTKWVEQGTHYIEYGNDLEFAGFLFATSLNPAENLARINMTREEFLKKISEDVAAFEYLNRELLVINRKLLEPPSREIEYAFIKWNNSDSTAIRLQAKKVHRYDHKKMFYPDAMHPLARVVFEKKKGERKIHETRAGIYVFCVKKIKDGGKWVRIDKIENSLKPIYFYWTIHHNFERIYCAN